MAASASRERPTRPPLILLGLGSNQGPSEDHLRGALAALRRHFGALRCADLYRSRALVGPTQPDYLNTAAALHSDLPPGAVLAVAKSLEWQAGRRLAKRHASRPLDIDLLLHGDLRSEHPELRLPHPGLLQRRFVLQPLDDLVPDLAVSPDGKTIRQALASLPPDPDFERVGWSGGPP